MFVFKNSEEQENRKNNCKNNRSSLQDWQQKKKAPTIQFIQTLLILIKQSLK